MEYPKLIKFKNKLEEDTYYLRKRDYIESLFFSIDTSENRQDKLTELTGYLENKDNELKSIKKLMETLVAKNSELEGLVELSNKSSNGESSVYKGEFAEKQMQYILTDLLGEEFDIDGDGSTKKMDIRLNHKTDNYTVGVEMKKKKTLSKRQDLDKFKRDKTSNNFRGAILINTQGPIGNIVKEKENFHLDNNELYIYSDDTTFVCILVQIFIKYLQCENKLVGNTMIDYIDMFSCIYNSWCDQKKAALKLDKQITNYLKKMNIPLANGHLFLLSKSGCKGTNTPY
uniref:Uncharacterized protein n=1 Tax=viral metagenome TaxID=1070528 RepID=A0A6C0B477_9ZZZZ